MFFIDFFKNLFSKKPINNNDEIITDEGFEKWNDIKNGMILKMFRQHLFICY